MREILFRGKQEGNGEWVFGYPIYDSADCTAKRKGKCVCNHNGELVDFIAWIDQQHEYGSVKINPSTVGQYTGLTDNNGRKIFEGDIVRYGDGLYRVVFEQRNGTAYFGIAISEIETWHFANNVPAKQMEVIGNIYDNPELLEVKQND